MKQQCVYVYRVFGCLGVWNHAFRVKRAEERVSGTGAAPGLENRKYAGRVVT